MTCRCNNLDCERCGEWSDVGRELPPGAGVIIAFLAGASLWGMIGFIIAWLTS